MIGPISVQRIMSVTEKVSVGMRLAAERRMLPAASRIRFRTDARRLDSSFDRWSSTRARKLPKVNQVDQGLRRRSRGYEQGFTDAGMPRSRRNKASEGFPLAFRKSEG